ncbi:MAG: ABC-2 transporter permease [Lachnospiraceae bacterium]|nr:ABC-2 transporter permease [Lachnospiraceae bacterium]
MLGLLYKDLCVMKTWIRSLAIWCGLFIIAATCIPFSKIQVLQDANCYALVPGLVVIYAMLYLGAFYGQYVVIDEKRRWSGFVTSTPVGYKQQVLSKYFFTLVSGWLVVVAVMIGEILGGLIPGTVKGASQTAVTVFYLLMLYQAIDYPFSFRYSSKNGAKVRCVLMILLFYVFMIYILFGNVPDTYELFDYFTKLAAGEVQLPLYVQYMGVFLPYVTMLIFYLSYKLSCRWYLKGVENYEA